MSVVLSQGGMSFDHTVSGALLVISSRLAVLPPLPGGRSRKSSSLLIVANGVCNTGVAAFCNGQMFVVNNPSWVGQGHRQGQQHADSVLTAGVCARCSMWETGFYLEALLLTLNPTGEQEVSCSGLVAGHVFYLVGGGEFRSSLSKPV